MKKLLHDPLFKISLLAVILVGLNSAPGMASSVYNCTKDGQSCVVKVDEGVIGDRVRIMDSKARKIAEGTIQKRKGSYAIVKISEYQKPILKGYPVIVEIDAEGSSLQWAASFSFQE